MFHSPFRLGLSTLIALLISVAILRCSATGERRSAVRFYDNIPPECASTRGIKQNTVLRVTSEEDLRRHYGITFRVFFNDGISPEIYGTLYYQNRDENRYCVAMPDGRFAIFADSRIGEHRRNVVHEVCYPIHECGQDE